MDSRLRGNDENRTFAKGSSERKLSTFCNGLFLRVSIHWDAATTLTPAGNFPKTVTPAEPVVY